jgi:GNAT superfamily N-acetyltransferase
MTAPATIADAPRVGPRVVVRPSTIDDVPFVLNSWLRSHRSGPWARYVGDATYYENHGPLAHALLELCPPLIACDEQHPELIRGWICGERYLGSLTVHYVYVRADWRHWGIARQLVEALGHKEGEPIVATAITNVYAQGRKKLPLRVVNNPYLALRRVWRT